MKATGIVRRIDELGRIVVPKEIRKNLRIREGDPLEIYTAADGEVVLKKFSPMLELKGFAGQYAEIMAATLGCSVCITDREHIVAVAGKGKKELQGRAISRKLSELIDLRKSVSGEVKTGNCINITDDDISFEGQVIQTIICQGDAIGAVVLLNRDAGKAIGDTEKKAVDLAARFLGRQMEG